MTGPACDIPCVDESTCGYDLICHSWGATYGLSVYGAYLYPCKSSWPEWAVAQLPGLFVSEHESSFGLAPGLVSADLGLTPAPLMRSSAGKLTLHRFKQSYRGFPVFGPDRVVTMVANYRGVVAIRGAIIDGRVPYLHADEQAAKSLAESSALVHTSQFTGIPVEELELATIFLVAVPRAEAIGWAVIVVQDGRQVATVVVEADPAEPDLLPLLHFSRSEAEALEDTVQVTVRAEDLDSEITMGNPFTGEDIDPADVDELFDVTPLLGSTEGEQFRLATERVVTYDASAVLVKEELKNLPVVESGTPNFLASPGTSAFRAQSHFNVFSNAFARTDLLMAGKWESLLPLYEIESSIPPAEFLPRAIVLTDVSASVRCGSDPACVGELVFPFSVPESVPVEYQIPVDTQPFEVIAEASLKDSNNIATVFHEFGHVIDLFADAGSMNRAATCTGEPGCAASCEEDTTDEAPPLTETFASLMAVWLGHELTAVGRDPTNCSYLPVVAAGVNGLPHNEICRPDMNPFPRLIRDDDPSCPASNICDKPSSEGFAKDKNDNFIPTGACEEGGATGGYQVSSMFQTVWEALHEQSCSETPPFTCQPLVALPQAGSSGDIIGGALLYAARVNSMTYRGFAGDMATYIACNFGEAAYLEFNQIACHHELRDCDAGVPLSCEVCGDNERQGGEQCDGGDLGGSTCETEGFGGGVLLCNDDCEFDTSMCTTSASTGDETGVPTSGPTSDPAGTTGASSGFVPTGGNTDGATTEQDSTTSTTVGAEDGGCDCRHDARTPIWPVWLLAGGLLPRRRRLRSTGRMTVLGGCLFVLSGVGCSLTERSDSGEETGAESTSGGSAETLTSDAGTATSTGEPADLRRFYGAFHYEDYTAGLKWEQPPIENVEFLIWWTSVVIEADSTLRVEYYYCGSLLEEQEFVWEPDGEGIRIVPPNGEGKSFKYAAANVLALWITVGEECGEIFIQGHREGSDQPWPPERYVSGRLCPTNVSQTECEFEFAWCDGPPEPPVCE